MGITETKRKGEGTQLLERGHLLIYGGVPREQRAKAGIGCIIHKRHVNKINKWNYINERILTVEIDLDKGNKISVVVVYGPNEDNTKNNKDVFWENLTDTTDNITGTTYVIGDFNARIGNKISITNVMGKYGEKTKNNNGYRLINYCSENNLIITNSFFQHKAIHKFTRVLRSKEEESIIDYILTNKENRKNIKDVKVKREPEIGSDHHLLLAKIKTHKNSLHQIGEQKKINKYNKVAIKNYRLNEKEVAEKYRKEIEKIYTEETTKTKSKEVEEQWSFFKHVLIKSASIACGTTCININKKQTKWWNQQLKEHVKIKKCKWKKYLQTHRQEDYDNYKTSRRKVKELVREEKTKSWEEFGNKLEKDYKSNQKLFFKTVKQLRKQKQAHIIQIKNRNGENLSEEHEIMNRWREYYETLLSIRTDVNKKEEQKLETTTTKHNIEEMINEQEVTEALRKIKKGKSGGHDKITPEMLKHMGNTGVKLLVDLINTVWKQEKIPKDWEVGIIMPIYKKGDSRECSNYRGITLLSSVAKIYEDIINRRLKHILEPQLDEAQCGFRKGRSIQDQIFTIKQLIEKIKKQNRNAYLAFIDLEKAFDRVNIQKIWSSLQKRKIPPKLLQTTKSLYKVNRMYVRTNNMESKEFTINNGLRQGGVLSPTLFNVMMDDMIKDTRAKTKKLQVGHYNLKPVEISECAFADDLMVSANSEKDLQENINIWENTFSKWNMKMNVEKSKVMHIGKDNKSLNLKINGKNIEQVETFKYLGVLINRTGTDELEIQKRLHSTSKLYFILKNTIIGKKEISHKTKITVYKTIYRPTLMFGSESWTLNESQKSRIQAMEMRYLRKVKGKTRMDKIRNEKIREDLEVESVTDKLEIQKLKWFGHLIRMNTNRPTKQIWECRTQNKRSRGRPKQTWNDELAKILRKRETTWEEAKNIARNKKTWKKFVYKES